MAERGFLYITPDRFQIGSAPDDDGVMRVGILLEYDASQTPWLAPELRLAISLSPEEARSMGQSLLRTADAAEAR
jgi:hypothetical protein